MKPNNQRMRDSNSNNSVSIPDFYKYLLASIVVLAYVCFACLCYLTREIKENNRLLEQQIIFNTISQSTLEEYSDISESEDIVVESCINYIPFNVPNIDSSFKAYMDYRKITSKSSDQYKFIQENAWVDDSGFMRCRADEGAESDYYLIALGSYYGTEIGTKYRITTDTGNVFYGVLADCKDDKHTNDTNQYTIVGNDNVVEFLVDEKTLDKEVKYHGTADKIESLSGEILNIEKIKITVS